MEECAGLNGLNSIAKAFQGSGGQYAKVKDFGYWPITHTRYGFSNTERTEWSDAYLCCRVLFSAPASRASVSECDEEEERLNQTPTRSRYDELKLIDESWILTLICACFKSQTQL